MNKQKFVERLLKLNLPRGSFCVFSGGSLLLQGVRDKTNDVDIAITKDLANKIGLYDMEKDEYGMYLLQSDVQCNDNFEELDKVKVDGFWCESLESVLEFKKSLKRPKDLTDIELIEKCLNSRRNY